MSLGDAYTLGVEVTGDIQSLRAELQSGTQLIANFANQSVAAMARAAGAMDSYAQAMQSSASRTTRSQQDQASQTRQAAQQIVQRRALDLRLPDEALDQQQAAPNDRQVLVALGEEIVEKLGEEGIIGWGCGSRHSATPQIALTYTPMA